MQKCLKIPKFKFANAFAKLNARQSFPYTGA